MTPSTTTDDDPFALARGENDPVLILAAEMRAVEARLREIPEEARGAALDQEHEQLEARWGEIDRGLETTPATTLAGVIEQLRYQRRFLDGYEGAIDTIIAGVRALDRPAA